MAGKPFQLVVGKGGVGKSTVAAAIAIAEAKAGHRTLVVELSEPGGLTRGLRQSPGPGSQPRQIGENLHLVWIDGESALAEYLGMLLPVRRVLAMVLQSKVYKYFVAAAPGLRELMTMGKLWFEHQRGKDGRERGWDRIIVDAGASGHSLQYLRMPKAAADTFGSGLVHRESMRVAGLLEDEDTTEVHVVALPEAMPLVEGAEIVEQLEELGLPLGEVFVNRCRPAVPDGAAEAVSGLEDHEHEALSAVAVEGARALCWQDVQETGIAEFERDTGVIPKRLPSLAAEEFSLDELETLADAIVEVRR